MDHTPPVASTVARGIIPTIESFGKCERDFCRADPYVPVRACRGADGSGGRLVEFNTESAVNNPFMMLAFHSLSCIRNQNTSECFGRPLIDALSTDFCRHGNRRADLRWNPQHQIAGIWPLRGPAELFAGFRIVIHRFFKSITQLFDRFAVKACHVIDPRNMTNEAAIFIVVVDSSRVSSMCHCIHGVTAACCLQIAHRCRALCVFVSPCEAGFPGFPPTIPGPSP